MKFIYGCLAFLIFSQIACKESGGAEGSGTFHPMSIQKEMEGIQLSSARQQAEKQIEFRSKNNPGDIQIISSDWWKIEGYFNIDKIESAVDDNYWLKLESDFTYSLGNGSEVTETGQCHYDDARALLVMLPSDQSLQPKEWEVKYGGDQFVLFGTGTFGLNNGMQVKFILTNPPI